MKYLDEYNHKLKIINKVAHIALIAFLFWIVILFHKNEHAVLLIYSYLYPISNILESIPYVWAISDISQSHSHTAAYLAILYLVMFAIFANIFFAANSFNKVIKLEEDYSTRTNCFSRLMAEHIYTVLTPPLDVLDKSKKQLPAVIERRFYEAISELFLLGMVKNYLLFWFVLGFVFWPIIVSFTLNDDSFGLFNFWLISIVMLYFQMRFLFEVGFVMAAIYMNKKGKK